MRTTVLPLSALINNTSFKSHFLRGQVGVVDLGMDKIEFDAVFDRGHCKLPDAFYGIEK